MSLSWRHYDVILSVTRVGRTSNRTKDSKLESRWRSDPCFVNCYWFEHYGNYISWWVKWPQMTSDGLGWPQMTSDDLGWPQWDLKISTELDLTSKWRVWLWLWERLVLLGDSFLVSYSILKFRSKIFLKNSSCLVFWNVCSWRRKMWMW